MDLMLPILSGLGLAGYSLNSIGKTPRSEGKQRTEIQPQNLNSQQNLYSSVYSKEIQAAEKKLAEFKNLQSQYPGTTGVIPPFYNDLKVNNNTNPVPQTNSILPQYNPQQHLNERISAVMKSPMFNSQFESFSDQALFPVGTNAVTAKPTTFSAGASYISELSGAPMELAHDNMVPSFGSSIKQNTGDGAMPGLLAKYTGTDKHKKKENTALFEPVKQNIYGSQYVQDRTRFYQSNLKTNVLPFPQIKEAPIPIEQFDRKFKNVDQLRVQPKAGGLKGRTIDGLKASIVTGKNFNYANKANEGAYISGPQKSFIKGQTKEKMDTEFEIERCNNLESSQRATNPFLGSTIGKSGPRQMRMSANNENQSPIEELDEMLYTIARDDNRHGLINNNSSIRNVTGSIKKYNDVNKEGFHQAPETERDTTSKQRYNGAYTSATSKAYRSKQKAKTTNKETTLYSYTGTADSKVRGNRGYQGKQTKQVDKILVGQRYAGAKIDKGYVDRTNYEEADIFSNRENIQDNDDYYTRAPIKSKLNLRNEETEYSYNKTENKENRIGNINRTITINNDNINEGEYDQTTKEHNISNRNDLQFTKELVSNDYRPRIKPKMKRMA